MIENGVDAAYEAGERSRAVPETRAVRIDDVA
jgi:hypothetical protein